MKTLTVFYEFYKSALNFKYVTTHQMQKACDIQRTGYTELYRDQVNQQTEQNTVIHVYSMLMPVIHGKRRNNHAGDLHSLSTRTS